ncbi:hypothetical protein ACN9M0_21255 [Streptomyces sp. R-07]|uniref:hypothetical protein n=1 Tax=Streptomyces sp. R-07 TaxID=3404052 RepID=UPI003CF3D103
MRSRRSARTLLLVPALLTALVGPMLPTGTAVAATPAPAVSAPSAPTSAPAVDAVPADEPTTDPIVDPTQTATEPTPEPTVEPTPTEVPCPALPIAPLGDPGDAVGKVTIEPQSAACFTVTVEKPGVHRILLDGPHDTYPGLYAGENRVACEDLGYKDAWCDLAAGQYTLKLTNTDWQATENRVALVALMAAAPGDCPAVDGTGYDTAPTTGQVPGKLSVVCHSFTAAPGDRITADFRPVKYSDSYAWITDDTGKRLCPGGNADGSEGCVLPEGTGGYRVLGTVTYIEGGFPAAYALKVRRLSDPAGCATVPVTAYGTAPSPVSPPAGCKTFTPTATGRYDVEVIDASGAVGSTPVYAKDGTFACRGYDEICTLTAGTTYTVFTDATPRILGRAATEGCTDGVTLGSAYHGTFSGLGEADCLNLPLPQGAHLAVLSDYRPDTRILDANGVEQCLSGVGLWDGTCELGGTAPYRAIVTDRDTTEGGDGYGLVVHRTDAPETCRTFLAGDLTANPTRMSVKTGDGVFADCLTIPADAHSAHEILQVEKTAGDVAAEIVVIDANGKRICEVRSYYNTFTGCALTPGVAHTVLVQGRDVPGETALIRRDVTATARGCVATPAVAVGGPSTGGVPAAPGTFLCHRVTTADAGDTLHLNVRDPENTVRLMAFDAAGGNHCDYFARGCAVTGSTAYQVLVQVPAGGTAPAGYRLDALRIATPAGPAPECVAVPNVSYGFGPLVGTLTEQKTALCAAVPSSSSDRFGLRFTPAGTFAQQPTPWLYDRTTQKNGCYGSYSSEGQNYECTLPNVYPKAARPSILVIGLPEAPAQTSTAVNAAITCAQYLCGTDERSIGTVGPATVGQGKISMTVTGSALPDSAKVVLTNGSFRAESTTLSVAPDRRSMTVALDLTNAPLGTLNTSVYAFGAQNMKPSVTVVAALRDTAAPSVSGTAVVGGTVTAKAGSWSLPVDSYAYQWRANGVAIAGATASTYTLPSALFGKQLSVAVTARKAGHPVVAAVSAAVVVKGVAPTPTKVPYFSGATRVGSKLTAVVGTWSPAPTSYAYQWRANGVAITGATGSSYVPVASVLGKKLTVTVTALRTGHLSGAYTTAGYIVAAGLAPKATVAPYLTGTVRVGRTLSLNRGTWTPAPTSYAYQWYANGRAISGATRTTFTLTKAQRGLKITVRVTAYRTGHTAGVAWTRSTAAVAG